MMKNMKKSVATMMVLGMTLTGAAGVYAGTQLEKISAYLNHGISFNVDGTAYTPTDGNGKNLLQSRITTRLTFLYARLPMHCMYL